MLGVVVGLTAEARLASGLRCPVRAGGGTAKGARMAAEVLIAQGCDALLSFGLAGGLEPSVRPGGIVVPTTVLHQQHRYAADAAIARRFGGPTAHTLLAADAVIAKAVTKAALHRDTGAHAVDLESGAVAAVAAEHSIPFAVLRAICDPVERTLPQAALIALDRQGAISLPRVLFSVLRNAGEIGDLIRLARDAAAARAALLHAVRSAAER